MLPASSQISCFYTEGGVPGNDFVIVNGEAVAGLGLPFGLRLEVARGLPVATSAFFTVCRLLISDFFSIVVSFLGIL